MIDAINSALSGLQNATKQVNQSAQNIAQTNVGGASNGRVIEDIVDIKLAETAYKANVETLKTAQDLSEELLRIFDERV